jgi:hypothetical protein
MSEIHIDHHKPKHVRNELKKPKPNRGTVVKELFVDMIPIILGILIALSFGSLKESWRESKEEKYYLTLLKEDLHEDVNELKSDLANYKWQKYAALYLGNYDVLKNTSQDSAYIYFAYLAGQTAPNISNTAFITLQTSGKLGLIRNKEIMEAIVGFYTIVAKRLTTTVAGFNDLKKQYFFDVLFSEVDYRKMKETKDIRPLLKKQKVQNALNILWFDEVITRYKEAIIANEKTIALLSAELK